MKLWDPPTTHLPPPLAGGSIGLDRQGITSRIYTLCCIPYPGIGDTLLGYGTGVIPYQGIVSYTVGYHALAMLARCLQRIYPLYISQKFFFALVKKCIDKRNAMRYIHIMESWQKNGKPNYTVSDILAYKKIWQPCIYIWTRLDLILYVGKSRHGTQRLQGHHVIKSLWQPGDSIMFFFFEKFDRKDILAWERNFINAFNPVYNKVKPLWIPNA